MGCLVDLFGRERYIYIYRDIDRQSMKELEVRIVNMILLPLNIGWGKGAPVSREEHRCPETFWKNLCSWLDDISSPQDIQDTDQKTYDDIWIMLKEHAQECTPKWNHTHSTTRVPRAYHNMPIACPATGRPRCLGDPSLSFRKACESPVAQTSTDKAHQTKFATKRTVFLGAVPNKKHLR